MARGMRLDASIKLHEKLRGMAKGFLRKAFAEQWSHAYALEVWYGVICTGPEYERSPRWVKERMIGYFDCYREMVYQHVTWHVWYEGRHVRTATHGGKAEIADWSKVDGEKGAHLWTSTGKVYHGYDPTGVADKKPTLEELKMKRLVGHV